MIQAELIILNSNPTQVRGRSGGGRRGEEALQGRQGEGEGVGHRGQRRGEVLLAESVRYGIGGLFLFCNIHPDLFKSVYCGNVYSADCLVAYGGTFRQYHNRYMISAFGLREHVDTYDVF